MKAAKSIIWMSLLALLSCQPSEQEPMPPEDALYPVTFSLSLKEEVLPFPQSKGIPPLYMSEPTAATRSEEENIENHCCTIEYILFKDDVFYRSKTFKKDESNLDFGIISDQLPRGSYDIIFVAHNASEATRTGDKLTFDQISDTFHFLYPLEIEPGEKNIESITLYRVVSKIEFVSTDLVPANATEFSIQLDQYPQILNLKTGHGEVPTEGTPSPFTFPLTEQISQTNLTHSFFTFVPEGGITLTADLKTTGTENTILRERTVENITPEINKIIRYTGRLYNSPHSDDEFTIVIDQNGTWATTSEQDIGD